MVLDPNNDECRFEIEAPSRVGQATVVAEGGGLVLEAAVTIPEHGDPEPLCLNPPCRANPLEGQAQLRVILDGVDSHSPINATIVPVGDANTRYGCGSSLFTCDIEALPAGETFSVTASGRDCRGGPVTVTIAEGDNDVSIPCVRAQPPRRTGGRSARRPRGFVRRCYREAGRASRARSRCSSRWFSCSSLSIRFSCAATMRSSAWMDASATPCASTELYVRSSLPRPKLA